MSDVVFARTRHEYGSYRDFWRLVELSGYPTCFVDEIDPSDPSKCYIFTPFNEETEAGWPRAKSRIVWWDLEWRDSMPRIPGVSEIWASDIWYANTHGVKYVKMGSNVFLNEDPQGDRNDIYDVAFLAYMTYRRQYLWDRLPVFKPAVTSAWGIDRHHIMSKSRAYLHIHQHNNVPTLPPLRLVMAAAYQLPFITELVDNPGDFTDLIIQEVYDRMIFNIRTILARTNLSEIGYALFEHLCVDWTFRHCIEANV